MTARSNIDIISMTLAEGDRVRGSTWPFRDHHEPSFAASWDALAIISLPARASEKTPVSKQRRRHAATTSCATRIHRGVIRRARSRRSEASSRTCPSEATLFSEQRLIFSRIYRQRRCNRQLIRSSSVASPRRPSRRSSDERSPSTCSGNRYREYRVRSLLKAIYPAENGLASEKERDGGSREATLVTVGCSPGLTAPTIARRV